MQSRPGNLQGLHPSDKFLQQDVSSRLRKRGALRVPEQILINHGIQG
jgi:hypothetical protein